MKIFFDMDGTLVDVAPRHYGVYTQAVHNFLGTPLSESDYWTLKRNKTSWTEILHLSDLNPLLLEEFLQYFTSYIESPECLARDRLFPGADKILSELIRYNHELYLVSLRRKPTHLVDQLQNLGIKDCFTKIMSGHSQTDGHDTKTKLIHDLTRDTDGMMIGDTEADIKTGKALGLITVAVLSGIRSEEFLRGLEPDYILSSVDALRQVRLLYGAH